MRYLLALLFIPLFVVHATPIHAAGVPTDATAVIYAKGGCTAADLIVIPATAAGHLPSEPADDGESGSPADETEGPTEGEDAGTRPDVALSEVFPDPVGTDTENEFIELRNGSDSSADLTGWHIEDAKGHVFALDGQTVVGRGYLALPYSTTKIALTNTGFSLSLIADDGTVEDTVDVGAAVTGESYAWDGNGWSWTPIVTAGAGNAFPEPVSETTDAPATSTDDVVTAGDADPAPEQSEATVSGTDAETAPRMIADLAELPDGDLVTVVGTASLPSGRAAATIFALMDPADDRGMFVRMYGTDRPDVPAFADVIVTGRVRRDDGVLSLNAISGGVALLASHTSIDPVTVQINDVGESMNGVLISVTGTVADKGTSWLLLSDPSGSRELTMRLPDGMPIGPVELGTKVTAVGVIRMRGGVPELLAMERNDVTFVPEDLPAEEGSALLDAAIPAANAGGVMYSMDADAKSEHDAATAAGASGAIAGAYGLWRFARFLRRKTG